jgi:hypothetical protein
VLHGLLLKKRKSKAARQDSKCSRLLSNQILLVNGQEFQQAALQYRKWGLRQHYVVLVSIPSFFTTGKLWKSIGDGFVPELCTRLRVLLKTTTVSRLEVLNHLREFYKYSQLTF